MDNFFYIFIQLNTALLVSTAIFQRPKNKIQMLSFS